MHQDFNNNVAKFPISRCYHKTTVFITDQKKIHFFNYSRSVHYKYKVLVWLNCVCHMDIRNMGVYAIAIINNNKNMLVRQSRLKKILLHSLLCREWRLMFEDELFF